jgi:sugar/nucleoside kinase (ribokinase family)
MLARGVASVSPRLGHCRRGHGYPPLMPSLPRPGRLARRGYRTRNAGNSTGSRIVVLGDLALDVVVTPAGPMQPGTDTPGRVSFVQGGSASNTARWLARLGARSTLVTAVGRDATGRALVEALRGDRVTVRAVRVGGARTARIAVLVGADGERSFVPDRGAADLLEPGDLKQAWFKGVQALHLPAYSLLGRPLGEAARRAIDLARDSGGTVSIDLASIGSLMAGGRGPAQDLIAGIAPDILFATASETGAMLGGARVEGLLDFASIAIVKRGPKGATVLARNDDAPLRFEVATTPLAADDSTGAGDAFDAGFLVAWYAARTAGRSLPASLHRAALAGHRAAARQLAAPRPELPLG